LTKLLSQIMAHAILRHPNKQKTHALLLHQFPRKKILNASGGRTVPTLKKYSFKSREEAKAFKAGIEAVIDTYSRGEFDPDLPEPHYRRLGAFVEKIEADGKRNRFTAYFVTPEDLSGDYMTKRELDYRAEELAKLIVKSSSVDAALEEYAKTEFVIIEEHEEADEDFREGINESSRQQVRRIYEHYLKTRKTRAPKKSGKAKKSSSSKKGRK
jgi:hypothetical protein